LYCGLDCSKRSPFKEQHKKETNLRKYGVTNSALLPEFKERNSQTVKFITKQIPKEEFIKRLEKRKTTNIQRFGYSSAMQNEKYFNKCMKTQYSRKVYILPSGKAIYLQGYEPQFLDFVFTNNLLTENDINYSPEKIRYIGFNNEDHYYFPDFDIPKLNLIVEIKSDYTEKRDKNIELKKRACLDSNKNYLRIVNNDFTEACQLLSSYSPFSIG
jgi:hypothetical protein